MTIQQTGARYDAVRMNEFADQLFRAAGFEDDKARVVAEILVEADLMGHATHGLALAPAYLEAAAKGALTTRGEPEIVSDRGACVTWNGRRLPGPWLTARAIDLAIERVATYGTVTVSIFESHHIGALAAYLRRATDRGFMLIIASSMPSLAGVAPFGGTRAVLTPNPLAAGIPTEGDPILLDISASITTLNMTRQLAREGRSFPHPWVMDENGNATDDPNVLIEHGGTLMPVGGLDHGHKGYSWAILVEALSQGLSGFGRADAPSGSSVGVFLQLIDPTAFGGQDGFKRQMSWLAGACRDSPPREGVDRVRVPGERAMAHKRTAETHGLPLSPAIIQGLSSWAAKSGLQTPEPIAPA